MRAVIYFLPLIIFFIIPNFINAQFYSISGYITNSGTDRSVENVSVFEKNSGIGTISNNNGYYRLLLNSENISLIISKSGFETFSTKFELKKDTVISVNLHLQSNSGNKIVVENALEKKKDSISLKKPISGSSKK